MTVSVIGSLPADVGIQRYAWDLRFDPSSGTGRGAPAGPGTYRVTLTSGSQRSVSAITVRADPILEGRAW